jgi:cation-transporting ATPase E
VFAFNYPLRPIHLTLLSWFTIGTPAFFLALEPNSERVHRGFLPRVLGKAVPAGVVIALLTMSVFAIVNLDSSIDTDHARTIAVMVAGSVALMNLYRVARPLNALRATLVASMVGLFILMFLLPIGRDLFELDTTAGWAYGLGFAAIAIAYPLLVLGAWLSQRIAGNPYWSERRARKAAASS